MTILLLCLAVIIATLASEHRVRSFSIAGANDDRGSFATHYVVAIEASHLR